MSTKGGDRIEMYDNFVSAILMVSVLILSIVWVNSWKRFYLYKKHGSPSDQDREIEAHTKIRQAAIFGMALTSGLLIVFAEKYFATLICLMIGIAIGLFWNKISMIFERYN